LLRKYCKERASVVTHFEVPNKQKIKKKEKKIKYKKNKKMLKENKKYILVRRVYQNTQEVVIE